MPRAPLNAAAAGALAVRAGANPQVIAKLPVVQVVAAAAVRLRISRDLILRVAESGHDFDPLFLHVPGAVAVGQRRWVRMECSVGFQCQVVVRQMLGDERAGGADVGLRFGERLLRQGIHKVQVDIVETGGAGKLHRPARVIRAVDAAQRFQVLIVQALHANGQTVHARVAIGGEVGCIHRAGVGFQGDFDVW